MINLRFHIVSLVAVFLALAIGIAVGATVVDQGLVSQSQRRISSLDQTLQDRAASIKKLRAEQTRAEKFAAEAEPRMVRARLAATPVLLVSDGQLSDAELSNLVATLRASGARLVGVMDVANAVGIDGKVALERARAAVGATSTRSDTIRFLVRQRVIGAIAQPFATGPLEPLVKAGFLQTKGIDGVDRLETVPIATRVIFLDRSVATDRAIAVAGLLRGLAAAKVPTVVLGDATSSVVRLVRTDSSLGSLLSTVDGPTTTAGRVAVVYALEDLGRGLVGQYGLGADTDRLIPSP